MFDVLSWLEASAIGRLVRDAGPWGYAILNLTHVLGVAAMFGSVLVLDLRLIGLWRRVPIAPLAAAATPVAAAGFTVAAASGAALLTATATDYAGNPFLLIKFPAIAVGLVNVLLLRRLPAWQARGSRELSPRETRQLAVFGGMSLVSWLTAVAAGRLIAYW